MKNSTRPLAIIIAFIILTIASCKKEDNTDARDKYVGTWNCQEKSKVLSNTAFEIKISKSTNNTADIIIYNFYNLGDNTNILASVNGNSITIPIQTVSANEIAGNGSFGSDSKISLSYTVQLDKNTQDVVTAVCTKK